MGEDLAVGWGIVTAQARSNRNVPSDRFGLDTWCVFHPLAHRLVDNQGIGMLQQSAYIACS